MNLSKDTEYSVCMMLACSQKYHNVSLLVKFPTKKVRQRAQNAHRILFQTTSNKTHVNTAHLDGMPPIQVVHDARYVQRVVTVTVKKRPAFLVANSVQNAPQDGNVPKTIRIPRRVWNVKMDKHPRLKVPLPARPRTLWRRIAITPINI